VVDIDLPKSSSVDASLAMCFVTSPQLSATGSFLSKIYAERIKPSSPNAPTANVSSKMEVAKPN